MIGKITLPGEPPVVATLGDDGKFSVSGVGRRQAAAMAEALDQLLDDSPRGPSEGQPGFRFLAEAAEKLKGQVEFGPIPKMPEGTVY